MNHLSSEQEQAFELFKQGHNLFITGPGGSGKTFLIKKIYDWCNENYKPIQVCALTGCAAVLLNCSARTIHSWSGIGLGNGDPDRIIQYVSGNKFKKNNWLSVKVLVIDEVSMMSYKLLTILDGIAKKIKKNDAPFGGIQIVFSGDFYQLPPVGNKNDPESSAFCFENPLWNELFDNEIELKHIFRQTDQSYSDVLNQIREGVLTKKGYNLLLSRCIPCNDETLKPTKILPRKDIVNKINECEMALLDTEKYNYSMQVIEDLPSRSSSGNKNHLISKSIANKSKLNHEQIQTNIELFKNNLMAEKELTLKIGSQVMCIVNLEMEGTNPIVNGSRGVVTGFSENGLPIVKFKSGIQQVMNYHVWEVEGEELKGYSVRQIPLILAWAITIHKSQGTTLDLAEIDIGNGIFECGQSYVALSRVKNVEGLYLSSFNPGKIRVNKKAQEYYSNLRKNEIK
jgi:ATP-dependent DNA helicase PIF1